MTELIIFLTGILVGAMNAIAGGGLLIGFPVMVAVGVPPIVVNATGHMVVIPGQIASTFAYRKYLRKISPRYLFVLATCFVGGLIGSYALSHTPVDQFKEIVPILILFAVLLFSFQPFIQKHVHYHLKGKKKKFGSIVLISLGLLPAAIYGGYFGAGFGFIMLAFLSFTNLHDIHRMNAVKGLAGLSIATASVLTLASSGLIDWKIGLSMAGGNVVGGYFGAHYSQRFSGHSIRLFITIVGICAAIYLAIWAHR